MALFRVRIYDAAITPALAGVYGGFSGQRIIDGSRIYDS
ncbi:hypothetical protein LCGC14_1610990 [marine sediment metagenome]|uniref:Uncharacterized protein n=1 Tax=marine sediment metagenome TaxID=412755 RepID=A0A0F9KP11_9ZZZZ